MITPRRRLPNRRASLTFEIESQGLSFTCSASWFADGSLAEVFLQNHKAGSMAGINAQDSAVVCSLALQHGVPLETIRRALMRDSRGDASGPLGVALDLVAAMDGAAPC
jgi:ribonucleoside-diphosphate reductase alpha chain